MLANSNVALFCVNDATKKIEHFGSYMSQLVTMMQGLQKSFTSMSPTSMSRCRFGQISTMVAFAEFRGKHALLLFADVAHAIGDFLRTSYLMALALFEQADEICRLQQAIRCAGVEPGVTAPHQRGQGSSSATTG